MIAMTTDISHGKIHLSVMLDKRSASATSFGIVWQVASVLPCICHRIIYKRVLMVDLSRVWAVPSTCNPDLPVESDTLHVIHFTMRRCSFVDPCPSGWIKFADGFHATTSDEIAFAIDHDKTSLMTSAWKTVRGNYGPRLPGCFA